MSFGLSSDIENGEIDEFLTKVQEESLRYLDFSYDMIYTCHLLIIHIYLAKTGITMKSNCLGFNKRDQMMIKMTMYSPPSK